MTLLELANQIAKAWTDEGWGTAKVEQTAFALQQGPQRFDIQLLDDEGEDHYVGNYAEPGLTISDLTEFQGVFLVKVNSIWIQALPSHIVGWAIGYAG